MSKQPYDKSGEILTESVDAIKVSPPKTTEPKRP
jgi:hypothetical protein